jgi:uncharacterized protein
VKNMNRIARPSQIVGLILSLSVVLCAQSTLPDGEGKVIAERMCLTCHGLEEITHARNTEERWGTVVDDMVARGAKGTDAEIEVVIRYLTTHFGPNSPANHPTPASQQKPGEERLRALLITGGHPFREEPFLDMFRLMNSIEFEHVKYGEGAEAKFKPAAARNYDVFVFYDMNQNCSAFLADLLALFEAGKPAVFLHHAIGSCPDDEEYSWVRGGKARFDQPKNTTKLTWSGYHPNTSYRAHVVPGHPITAGMSDFDVVDETYSNYLVNTNADVFLSTEQPGIGRHLGWSVQYKKSLVAYILLGHGPTAYSNENYRKLVERSILWAAGRLSSR